MKFSSKRVLGFATLIIGLSLGGIGLWLLSSPVQYQAAVRVQFGRDSGAYDPYDPYFVQAEMEGVRSDTVLSNVVEKLNRFGDWGGQKVGVAKAIHLLKKGTTVQPVPNVDYVFEICVIDRKPETAARIANAIASAYCDNRVERIRQERIRGLTVIKDEYRKEEAGIKAKQEQLEQLKKELNLANPEPGEAMLGSNYPAYFQAKRELTNEEATQQHRKEIIAMLKSTDNSGPAVASEFGIRIVDPAVVTSVPIGPNRWLGLVMLFCGLGVSVPGFYLILAGSTTTKTTR
ncbi:MAG TPA: hypothetical protein VJT54_09405 [Verrucomicrobiae bacterium]|nr:hypothetical protein [Verrucomicrobiae bacterium]